jgi:hypothetical protein
MVGVASQTFFSNALKPIIPSFFGLREDPFSFAPLYHKRGQKASVFYYIFIFSALCHKKQFLFTISTGCAEKGERGDSAAREKHGLFVTKFSKNSQRIHENVVVFGDLEQKFFTVYRKIWHSPD